MRPTWPLASLLTVAACQIGPPDPPEHEPVDPSTVAGGNITVAPPSIVVPEPARPALEGPLAHDLLDASSARPDAGDAGAHPAGASALDARALPLDATTRSP